MTDAASEEVADDAGADANEGHVDAGETDAGDAAAADDDATAADDDAYGGVVGAFPYAYRATGSRLFRTYVVAGGLVTGVVVVLFALAVVTLIGATAQATGGTFTFSRAFFVVVMLLVVAPLVAPVLAVARRHRRGGSTVRYDRALAAAGYLFVFSLYVGLVVSAPASLTEGPTGPLAPVVAWLYSLPRAAGVVPPVLAAAAVYAVHRAMC